MREMAICKACQYVMPRGELRDNCPACGVPARMFEAYTDRLSPRRRRILLLDLHPILVHFTQAFAFSLPLLCLAALAPLPRIQPHILSTIRVLSCAFPVVILLSFLAGMLDGKIRFRRVGTPLLQRKMLFGLVLLLLACLQMTLVLLHGQPDNTVLLCRLALSAAAAACAAFLGLVGVRLLPAAFPG
jgi:O-antigen/teichoic acid export membrane protein